MRAHYLSLLPMAAAMHHKTRTMKFHLLRVENQAMRRAIHWLKSLSHRLITVAAPTAIC